LQAMPCIPASDLPAADILAFARGLQNNTAELSSAQLSCLARLLAAKNLTADFKGYPPDLLLFFDSAEVGGESCKEFYTLASQGHLDLLPKGSARRTRLLRQALTCLGVRSSHLDPEQLSSLGALVCDMEPETITASAPGVLENLKLCSALTQAQQDALNALLLGGDTAYGDPSSWDFQTLQRLGPLVLALNQTTLNLVAKEAREALGRSIKATYGSQGRSQREKSLLLLRALVAPPASAHPRRKRNTGSCSSTPITPSTITDPDFIFDYDDSEEFELCLSNEVVKEDLQLLVQQPLTTEFQMVLKKKLQQVYPAGIPEEQLKVLGELSRLYTPQEISRWNLTSSDTLLALLDPSNGNWNDAQIQELIDRYLALGGTWSGALLQTLGGENLCHLQEGQIQQIPPEALRTAGQLVISSCSQAKKNQLYKKAQQAFSGQSITWDYYCRMRPYLSGAPAEDLKELAESGITIDMDMDTFLALNPDELEKLSVTDVKNLLGENLSGLKEAENETSVKRWLERQPQWELDSLGIGLQGGFLGTTTTATTASTAATSSRPTPGSSTAPTRVPTAPNSTTHHPGTTHTTAANSNPTPPPTPTPPSTPCPVTTT
ncbi:MSLNL protein, partial [Psilopogon haemacephalus]|nr:MSLNL protein [Psilopogon haemacephalus]